MIFGVDCEKCHGPAARHVEYQSQNPGEKTGKYVINPSTFSRQQKLDMCALCHGGNIKRTQPPFSFTAGDKLSDYFEIDSVNTTAINFGTADVHGNQYGLLRASKCFRMSKTLTCNSCHNPHENERGNLAVFSQRCMSCHNTEHGSFCTVKNTDSAVLKKNCIDCHMPAMRSQSIVVFTPGEDVPKAALFRTHFISIYQEEIKKFMQQKKDASRKHTGHTGS
jgi:mono/diheme cytochrome c family protein